MNKESQQLRGIVKDIRNTSIPIEHTIKRILNRIQDCDLINDRERQHIEKLFKERMDRELKKI